MQVADIDILQTCCFGDFVSFVERLGRDIQKRANFIHCLLYLGALILSYFALRE